MRFGGIAKVVQYRQGKACGFTSTCLRRRHHISALKHMRDRLCLYWGRGVVSLLLDGFENWLAKAQVVKFHELSYCLTGLTNDAHANSQPLGLHSEYASIKDAPASTSWVI